MKAVEAAARAAVYTRSRGRCEGCGGTATDYSHRRRRNVTDGHEWCPCNALHLCRTCHAWAHQNPELARLRGWHVSQFGTPTEVAAALLSGWFALDCTGSGRWLHADEISVSDGSPFIDRRDLSRPVGGTP